MLAADMVNLASAHGVPQDVTLANAEGNVALHWACLNGHVEVGVPYIAGHMRHFGV